MIHEPEWLQFRWQYHFTPQAGDRIRERMYWHCVVDRILAAMLIAIWVAALSMLAFAQGCAHAPKPRPVQFVSFRGVNITGNPEGWIDHQQAADLEADLAERILRWPREDVYRCLYGAEVEIVDKLPRDMGARWVTIDGELRFQVARKRKCAMEAGPLGPPYEWALNRIVDVCMKAVTDDLEIERVKLGGGKCP